MHLRRKAGTETVHPSVSACVSVITGSHLDVCVVKSTEGRRMGGGGGGRKENYPSVSASVEYPLVLPSPFSWFTLECKDSSVSVFIVHTRNVRILPSPFS